MRTPTGLPDSATSTAGALPGKIGEHGLDRLVELHRRERGLHGLGDVVVQRLVVSEEPLEQAALAHGADHVGERLDRLVPDDRDLRDAVALHQLDRGADLRVRLDDDEPGHPVLLRLLEREHLLHRR